MLQIEIDIIFEGKFLFFLQTQISEHYIVIDQSLVYFLCKEAK